VFEGVYFIPKLTTNIVSVGHLNKDGYQILIGASVLVIWEPGGKLLATVKWTVSKLYWLTVMLLLKQARCLMMRGEAEAWRWHEHLGHLNFPALRKMAHEELVRGLPDIASVEHPCEACMAGKQKRASFLAQAQYRVDTALELVHGDLCGKISPQTMVGNNYFLLMVDDKSRYMSILLIPSKDRAPEAIQRFQLTREVDTRKKLGGLWTDRGGDFNLANFLDYCLEHDVRRQLMAPYSPQQIEVVECHNSTVVGVARSMLKAKRVPNCFWGKAVIAVVYVLNRAPTRHMDALQEKPKYLSVITYEDSF
jgi:hypothetical protein